MRSGRLSLARALAVAAPALADPADLQGLTLRLGVVALAAAGHAALTLAFGVVIARYGAAGVGGAQAALGLAAATAWLVGAVAEVRDALAARAENRAAAAPDRPAARNRTWT